LTTDEHEALKQNLGDVARGYVGSLLCLAVCGNSVSAKLWCCRGGVSRRHSSDVDDAAIYRHLERSIGAVGVTLRFHPEASN